MNPFLFTKDLQSTPRSRLGELLDWVVGKVELLRKLHEGLGDAVQAWHRFDDEVIYFSDMQNSQVMATLTSLKKTLGSLTGLQQRVRSLTEPCEKAEKVVSLSRPVRKGLALTDKLEIFIGTIGNEINAESQELSRRSHAVNLETNTIAQETAKLNRQSTAAAVESSQTTRINVQLFLITTPFILALQYFGAEKDIFSFERNPRTFTYAVCVLFCALPILTYVLSLLNQSWDNLVRRFLGKTKSTDEERPVSEYTFVHLVDERA